MFHEGPGVVATLARMIIAGEEYIHVTDVGA